MNKNRLKARVLSRTPLHEGFLRLYRYRLEVQAHDGDLRDIEWELMERGNSVGVLAYDLVRDAVVLGNECRPGALVSGDNPFRDQLIAGVLEAGESPIDAAVREMREETGLTLADPAVIHPGAYASSGGTSERIALVFGLVDTTGVDGMVHGSDAKESVLAVVQPAQAFIERVLNGEIDDCKTLLAGYWFARHQALGR
jgi:ADP-ribose pyrophosphatase